MDSVAVSVAVAASVATAAAAGAMRFSPALGQPAEAALSTVSLVAPADAALTAGLLLCTCWRMAARSTLCSSSAACPLSGRMVLTDAGITRSSLAPDARKHKAKSHRLKSGPGPVYPGPPDRTATYHGQVKEPLPSVMLGIRRSRADVMMSVGTVTDLS